MNIHPAVKQAAEFFTRAGKQVFLVGGVVRDQLRGQKAKDWDLATDATPEEVIALFCNKKKSEHMYTSEGDKRIPGRCFVVPTGIKHGTVTLHLNGEN